MCVVILANEKSKAYRRCCQDIKLRLNKTGEYIIAPHSKGNMRKMIKNACQCRLQIYGKRINVGVCSVDSLNVASYRSRFIIFRFMVHFRLYVRP